MLGVFLIFCSNFLNKLWVNFGCFLAYFSTVHRWPKNYSEFKKMWLKPVFFFFLKIGLYRITLACGSHFCLTARRPWVEQEVGCILTLDWISGRGWMENYRGLLYSAQLGWLAFSKRDTFQRTTKTSSQDTVILSCIWIYIIKVIIINVTLTAVTTHHLVVNYWVSKTSSSVFFSQFTLCDAFFFLLLLKLILL